LIPGCIRNSSLVLSLAINSYIRPFWMSYKLLTKVYN